MRKIRRRIGDFKGIKLVYREENAVADGLARWAYSVNTETVLHSYSEIPTGVQKLIFFDRIGLPSYRPKCN